MFKNFKIGPKLAILFLVISVIPLLAIGITNYFLTRQEIEKRTLDALQAVNDSRAAHINHAIQLRQEQAKEFAGAYVPRQLSESGVNDGLLLESIQNDLDSTYGYLKTPSTSKYKNIDRKTDIEGIGIWDVHGNIIANTDRTLIGKKMPLDYIQNVYRYGTYFVGFEKDPLTGNNFLILLEEIRSWKTNTLVGAISLTLGAGVLDEIMTAREGLGQSGETYIVDKQYRMITPSRFQKDAVLNVRVINEGTRACFAGQTAPMIYRNYRGVEVLGVQKYLPDEEWCLLAEVEAQEALAPVRAFRNRTIALGGISMVAIIFFAFLASRFFTRPILRLHEAAQEISRGHYGFQLAVEGKDEMGELTKAFNVMAKSLADVTAQLEEKTKALFKHLALSTRQKKELREVNQELDSFVYTASHDLRAPLRGIASFASFLEEDYKGKLDDQGRDYLNEIRKGATKMSDLIDDLLTLSRISRIKNPYEVVDIKELLAGVLGRIKFDIEQNQAQVVVPENIPPVCCDRIKMAEVFLNLINNAIKFSSKIPAQHPRVEVGYSSEGVFHRFSVKDNGIGIDPKYHKQIFGIFKRLHTDKEYEGTGAGLSIIKRVIDDHGGEIRIDSQVGAGATFYFTIPMDLKPGGKTEDDEERPEMDRSLTV